MRRKELWIPRVKSIIRDTITAITLYQAILGNEEIQQQRYETHAMLNPEFSVVINWQEAASEHYQEQERQKSIERSAHIERLKSLLDQLQIELDRQYEAVEEAVLDVLLFGPASKVSVGLSLLHWCDWSTMERRAYCSQFGLPLSDNPAYESRSFSLNDQDLRQSVRLRLLRLRPEEKARGLCADAHHTHLWLAVDYYSSLLIDTFSAAQSTL